MPGPRRSGAGRAGRCSPAAGAAAPRKNTVTPRGIPPRHGPALPGRGAAVTRELLSAAPGCRRNYFRPPLRDECCGRDRCHGNGAGPARRGGAAAGEAGPGEVGRGQWRRGGSRGGGGGSRGGGGGASPSRVTGVRRAGVRAAPGRPRFEAGVERPGARPCHPALPPRPVSMLRFLIHSAKRVAEAETIRGRAPVASPL